jgi:glycerol-3-phosphate dehydrogenase subunit C
MKKTPEGIIRDVVEICADCESCRDFMETCRVFPELYRLWDVAQQTGAAVPPEDLRRLADLCNFCAVCPCADIRAKIIQAKTAFIDRDGLPPVIRLLEDVETIGRMCGRIPRLANLLFQNPMTAPMVKKAAGIHPDRKFPVFPQSSFKTGSAKRPPARQAGNRVRKVAYFAGCTGRHLFPGVPEAAVNVLETNGVEVFVPEKGCCGMPGMLEGDRRFALRTAGTALDLLSDAVDAGYEIVCSCPTCGFMLKKALKDGAYYSEAYQASVGGDGVYLKLPEEGGKPGYFKRVSRSMFKSDPRDEGYFSALDPLKRIRVADHTLDLGEYLAGMMDAGDLRMTFGPVPERTAYYPPCHLREQNIGRPYMVLLAKVPELTLVPVEGTFLCCGMAGIMGFKQGFHSTSLAMGESLVQRITAEHPETLLTDCLSCRVQFNQTLPYPVRHPIEILAASYDGYRG